MCLLWHTWSSAYDECWALPFHSTKLTRAVLAWYTAFHFSAHAGSYDYQQLTERCHYSVMTHRTSGEYVPCPDLMGTVGKALTHIGKGYVLPGMN